MWQACGGCRRERPVRVPWVRVPVNIVFYVLSQAPRPDARAGPCHLWLCVATGAEEAPGVGRKGRAVGFGRCVRVCRADARPGCTGVWNECSSLFIWPVCTGFGLFYCPQWHLHSRGAAAMQPLQRPVEALQRIRLPWL